MISNLIGQSSRFISNNSPALLTGIGVVGTITTAILATQAGMDAQRELSDEFNARAATFPDDQEVPELPFKEKAKIVWPVYIPAAASGVMTISAIILANRIGNKRTAALAAAYAISEKAIVEYRDKVREVVGVNKEGKIRDAVAQEQVDRTPVPSNLVVIEGTDVLCFDAWSARYFKSSMEQLKSAQNAINYNINKYDYASLSDFYDELDLPHTQESDDIGWNIDGKLLELEYSSCISPEGKPALSIRFVVLPFPGYTVRK